MKTSKPPKTIDALSVEKNDKAKGKKKMAPQTTKVNVKSSKFWNEYLDTDTDDVEKFMV